MALPQEDKGVKKTPSDKDALPDRRKATPRNEELAKLIGEEIETVMPSKEESSEQTKMFTMMAGYLEILAGKAEKGDAGGGEEESAFSKLGKLGKVFALVVGSFIGLLAAQLKAIGMFAKLFTPARLQVQIRTMFKGLTGTVKGFGTTIKTGFSNLLKPLTGLFKGGAKGALGKTPQVLKNFMNGLKPFGKAFADMFKVLKTGMSSLASGGGMLTKVMGFFKSIGRYIGTMLKAVSGVAKVASKVFLPLLIVITLFDTIKGAIKGFAEGGIIGGLMGAVKGLFNSLIFGPLDMVKGAVAWVLGLFGFDKAKEMLNSFSFASMFSKLIDGIGAFLQNILDFMIDIIMAPVRPIMELFNSMMNMFTNADGEGMFKNISDFFFDLILIIPKFFLNILDAVAGLFGFDGLKEKVYGMFDAIMDNFGIPAFSFTIPLIGKKVSFDGFFPFRDDDPDTSVEGGDEGAPIEGTESGVGEGVAINKKNKVMTDGKGNQVTIAADPSEFSSSSKLDEAIARENEIANTGTDTGSKGGNTTVVNNTNVSNQANTATNSMAFPKTSKNRDNLYHASNKYLSTG
tara:strand:- start:6376 stop:8091 length:1716 start_codon:yes stop_codon:yes gene_type:complete